MTRGTPILGRRHLATAVLAVAALLAALIAAPAALAAPRVVIAPSNGIPGAALKATATGFPVGPIEFRWDGGLSLGTVASDSNGRAVLNFVIPGGASPGAHFVRACSPGCAVSDDGNVTVLAAPTPPPTAPPTPAPTPKPTPKPTPAPTPRPSVPGSTPRPPGSTPLSTLSGAQASATGSLDPNASALPTALATPSGSTATTLPPVLEPSSSPTALPHPGAATSDAGSLVDVAVPVGAFGVLVLIALVIAHILGRRPVARATSKGPQIGGPDADDLSALNDPVAPFLEPMRPPVAPPDALARPRTISIHVEQIEADDI